MGSLKKLPISFDLIHFLPAQVFRIPLETSDIVNTSVTIGPQADRPLKLMSPIMISGMSLGSVSGEGEKNHLPGGCGTENCI